MEKTNINGILTLNSKPLGFIEIVKGFGAKKFSANIFAEYFRRSVFAETFSAGFSFWNHILNLGLPGGWG